MAYLAVSDYYDRERDAWIDEYLADHPDATEFEAALAYETEPLPSPFPIQETYRDNHQAQ